MAPKKPQKLELTGLALEQPSALLNPKSIDTIHAGSGSFLPSPPWSSVIAS